MHPLIHLLPSLMGLLLRPGNRPVREKKSYLLEGQREKKLC